ncbi:MAG: carbohydrate ABC transporter permease [Candidatus Hodarchaeota archaeon]
MRISYPRVDRFLNFLRLIGDFRFKRTDEYDVFTKASIISGFILVIVPFLPIWQKSFEFIMGVTLTESGYVDYDTYNSAFNFQGFTYFWAYLLVLIGLVNLVLAFTSPASSKSIEAHRRILMFSGGLGIVAIFLGLFSAHGLHGLMNMLLGPGVWLSLAASIILIATRISPEGRVNLRENLIAYAFIAPTLILMMWVFYIPIFVALFFSFQDFYRDPIARFSQENMETLNVGFTNYRTIFNNDLILYLIVLIVVMFWVKTSIQTALRTQRRSRKLLFLALTMVPVAVLWFMTGWFFAVYTEYMNVNPIYSVYLDPKPGRVTMNTLVWTFACVIPHVLIGLMLALMMNLEYRGRAFSRATMIVPWAVPSFISVTIFAFFILPNNMAADVIFKALHLPTVDWMNTDVFLISAIIVNIWLGYSFMTVAYLAGLQSIPDEMYEVAAIDGATTWQKFRHVTLPFLKPIIVVSSILGFLWTFNMFNVIFIMSRPVASALDPSDYYILVVYIFFTFRPPAGNWGMATTISFILFLALIIMVYGYTKLTGRGPYEGIGETR